MTMFHRAALFFRRYLHAGMPGKKRADGANYVV